MYKPGKIGSVKKKIHARARKVLYQGIDDFVWASGSGRKEVCGRPEKFSGRKGKTDRGIKFHRVRGSSYLGQAGSCSTTQGLKNEETTTF